LPELLRKVRAGSRFTITENGEAVAELVPAAHETQGTRAATRLRHFMKTQPPIAVDIKALTEEGRD
jgi:antitoxin (DNA-binding transcriptional repressor) of toxin-antitoxin stability system